MYLLWKEKKRTKTHRTYNHKDEGETDIRGQLAVPDTKV